MARDLNARAFEAGRNLGSCCCTLISLFWGLITLIIYTTRHLPTFYIEQFYVPALNLTASYNSTTIDSTIFFDLKLQNENWVTGLYYDDPLFLNLSYILPDDNVRIHMGEYAMHGFYQGNGKTKHVRQLVDTRALPVPPQLLPEVTDETAVVMEVKQVRELEESVQQDLDLDLAVHDQGPLNETKALAAVVFRVDFVTEVRHKLWWNHNRERMVVGADVEVNDTTGEKIKEKGIKLVNSGEAVATIGRRHPKAAALLLLATAYVLL